MSKTFKTAPAWVKTLRNPNKAEVRHSYRCTALGKPCDLGERSGYCYLDLPRHVAAEPWHRRGTAVVERRGRVKQALGRAALLATNGAGLEDLLLPEPHTNCKCYMCS